MRLLKHHNPDKGRVCKRKPKEKAKRQVDLVSYGMDYGLKRIQSKWRVVDDGSVRIVHDLADIPSNVRDAAREMARQSLVYRWAVYPRERKTKAKIKDFLHDKVAAYLDSGKLLRGHKASQLIVEAVDEHGLPVFSVMDYISLTSTVNHVKASYSAVKKSLSRRIAEQVAQEEVAAETTRDVQDDVVVREVVWAGEDEDSGAEEGDDEVIQPHRPELSAVL